MIMVLGYEGCGTSLSSTSAIEGLTIVNYITVFIILQMKATQTYFEAPGPRYKISYRAPTYSTWTLGPLIHQGQGMTSTSIH